MPDPSAYGPVPSFDDVLRARRRIEPHVHRTPVLTSSTLDGLVGATLFFKCESFQRSGSFKARGASNAVFGLDGARAARGVATHSSGNHGLALAWAAGRRGIEAGVVVPRTASAAKTAAVRGYGGRIVECEPTSAAREAAAAELVARSGADFVHPYADARVIAGQGTCALELIEQVEGLDTVVTPIGGGGLISGTALTLGARRPEIELVAAEPERADDAARSLRAGELIVREASETVADGLKMPLAPLTWHFVRRHVSDVLTASEAEIVEAMRLVWQRMKLVVEPSCAVPLAALVKHRERFAGRRVGIVLTGGNVDLAKLPW